MGDNVGYYLLIGPLIPAIIWNRTSTNPALTTSRKVVARLATDPGKFNGFHMMTRRINPPPTVKGKRFRTRPERKDWKVRTIC